MDSRDLDAQQAQRIVYQLRPSVWYLHRLQKRMERRGFPGNDPLYRKVLETQDKLSQLVVELHYLSVDPTKLKRGVSPLRGLVAIVERHRRFWPVAPSARGSNHSRGFPDRRRRGAAT